MSFQSFLILDLKNYLVSARSESKNADMEKFISIIPKLLKKTGFMMYQRGTVVHSYKLVISCLWWTNTPKLIWINRCVQSTSSFIGICTYIPMLTTASSETPVRFLESFNTLFHKYLKNIWSTFLPLNKVCISKHISTYKNLTEKRLYFTRGGIFLWSKKNSI